jgi:flagellar assembly factor FliW
MKTAATAGRRMPHGPRWPGQDSVFRFEEGLVGFSECKDFVLVEKDGLASFRLLQSIERPELGFLVLDPQTLVHDYCSLVPQREWETIRVKSATDYQAFVICVIGSTPSESTANFQAPLIVNYKKMIGRQIILTDTGLSVRHPLLQFV